MILLQFGLIAGLILTVASLSARLARLDATGSTSTAPAQDAIEMQIVKFGDPGIYQGPPSDEVDEAWENLYRYGISAIPKDQAALLPNKTYPLSFNTSQYVVHLEVFHHLHCLNQIRKAVHRDYYGPRTVTEGGRDASESTTCNTALIPSPSP
ncbi:hypothetical protein B0H16DRAFT_1566964 [Mycena metata]|uniref:Uncharacterized protein n=1 Tax=Mycena metata TaxID=1033252 RepID=A0AAD7IDH0_9AGAR|nr:hypothetical protein B0H16DRAFT_1566964 [Mycena metata]